MAEKYREVLSILDHPPSGSESNEMASSPPDKTALIEPFTYITSTPGKDFRGAMMQAFNCWLHVPEPKLQVIGHVVSMLHNASLLIDDIEDNSQLRRGRPVAHRIYGVPQTINSANYVYFLALQEILKLKDQGEKTGGTGSRLHFESDMDQIVTTELLNLHRGQGLDLLWRDSLRCPSEEEYIAMVNDKTGGLLRVAVKLMMACASQNINVDYVPLVNLIGIYFQIRDDYMNLQDDQYSTNKGFAEDLSEGKFSFPIVHGIHADTTNRRLLNVLQKRPGTPTLKHHAISYLRDHSKSFEYTREVLTILEKRVLTR
ncbi:isoprenoid synthase domain-containing protein [Multifurca ochricompacta]|uniref:(2E,6E)-farnesyl diphosphate synthase n=1 Tax=Multifurca ochricompacta TaxID=376703 RepID=A0AAD4M4X5_9AGAM|nr:isoprenoid synthase domain-containing protein [Multifurca ochricompacta]